MRWGFLGREGWLWGSACWRHLDPNLWCLHSGGSSCSRRPIGSQTHFAGDTVGLCTPDLQPVVGGVCSPSKHTVFSSLRSEEVQPLAAPEEELASSQDDSQHCLWVDEFAPRSYTELLSDDVRLCSCSSVMGSFVAKKEKCRIQLAVMLPAHGALE